MSRNSVRTLTREDEERVAQLDAVPQGFARLVRDSARPLVWVCSEAELNDAVAALRNEPVVGFDVETTLGTRALCLLQIAGQHATYLIDALDVPDLARLARL